MKNKIILLLLAASVTFVSCFSDLDDNQQEASVLDINDFIYRGLNFFYLYKADTPELGNDFFATNEEKNTFLNSFETPEALFAFLKSNQDEFSILVDNFIELENALNGVTLNNGMKFGLVRYPSDNTLVFGYVRYVVPNSDAATKSLQRGMIFNRVDGQQLNENNFSNLLAPDTYTIGLADFDGDNVTELPETIELIKEEITENPVAITETLTVDGQKVGYIMYNAFTRDFNADLNNAFGDFVAEGINELVIDLRYNGGGSVETAVDLQSMVTGQFNGQICYTEQWNADRQDEYASDGLFNQEISNGDAINSLGLSRVFILTSGRTASASELVINGLTPYINVVQVGTNTRGKFQASFLLYDAPAPNFSRAEANPGHTYAMLPLVFKTANANGFTDFVDGLVPDFELAEDYSNLGTLGNQNEPLLAAALALMFPGPAPQPFRNFQQLEEIGGSNDSSLLDGLLLAN